MISALSIWSDARLTSTIGSNPIGRTSYRERVYGDSQALSIWSDESLIPGQRTLELALRERDDLQTARPEEDRDILHRIEVLFLFNVR